MDWSGCEIVEVIPGKVSGVPLIRGTRMPADQVMASLADGETVEELVYNHDLDPADVRQLEAYINSHHLVPGL